MNITRLTNNNNNNSDAFSNISEVVNHERGNDNFLLATVNNNSNGANTLPGVREIVQEPTLIEEFPQNIVPDQIGQHRKIEQIQACQAQVQLNRQDDSVPSSSSSPSSSESLDAADSSIDNDAANNEYDNFRAGKAKKL